MKNVTVSVKGYQSMDNDEDVVELKTVGTYNFKFTIADGAVGTGCIEIM